VTEKVLAPEPVRVACKSAGRLGFGFGRRFFLLLFLGALWAVPAFWDNRFLWIMGAWDVCAVVAWAMDLGRLPRPERLHLERSWTGAASLRNTIDVVLQMENPGKSGLQCQVLDDVPESLRPEPPIVEFKVGAQSTEGQPYPVRPLQRGDVHLGKAYLRYQSAAHFAERWAVADLKQSIRIFPDLEEARRHNIYLTRARQIELEKRLIRQRGVGREFESLREYQEGDEFRNICWTATARRGKYVTKLHQVERSQAVWLVVDAGRL
jgi:uncharacterized protein (DUF58 family)